MALPRPKTASMRSASESSRKSSSAYSARMAVTKSGMSYVSGVDDATLQRFLVARQWKIDKAALMIEKHILWRSSFPLPVDPLLCADELTSGRTFVRGFDRWGHPIIWHFPRAGQPSQDARAGLKAAVFWAEAVAQQQGGNADGKVALVVCRAGERAPAFNLGAMSELLSTLSHNFPDIF